MRVLDLFAGTGSATRHFADMGDRVMRVERDDQFDADRRDVRNVRPDDVADFLGGRPDFVWASPPCTSFSMAAVRHHWAATTSCRRCSTPLVRAGGERWDGCDCPPLPDGLTYTPKSDTARDGLQLLITTLSLVHRLRPAWWAIENPRALMRKMPVLAPVPRVTITHCQYGDPRRMKPTDLFGVLPPTFHARACTNGSPCHEPAPRGAKTGTQGLGRVDAGMLPPGLPVELRVAIVEAHSMEVAA